MNRSQVRLSDCYLDWNDVVFAEPTQVTFTNGIFLCGARVRLLAPPSGAATGVYIAANVYVASYCGFHNYSTVEADGAFTSATDVTVVGGLAEPQVRTRSTSATLTVASAAPTTRFTADFSGALLFDPLRVPIAAVAFSLTLAEGYPPVAAVARKAVGGVVTVETAAPVVGSVLITVDQSARRAGA